MPEKAKPKSTKKSARKIRIFQKSEGKFGTLSSERGKKTDEGDIPRQTSCTLESCPG
jgi:hypothetical protein